LVRLMQEDSNLQEIGRIYSRLRICLFCC
jgi:hypothetical protein